MTQSRAWMMVLVGILVAEPLAAQIVPLPPAPDERMKADVLLVVDHPGDETAIGCLLAVHRRIGRQSFLHEM